MLKYLGVANILLITVGLYVLARRDDSYSFLKQPISSIAKYKNNRLIYIILFSIFTLIQIVFALIFVNHLNLGNKRLLDSLFAGGGLVLLIAGLTTHYYPVFHRWVSWAGVIVSSLGILLTGHYIFRNFALLTTALVIATILLTTSTQYLRIVKKAGYWELPLLCLVVLWNLLATLMMFMKSA
jgi:hypothetical protein